MSAKQKKKKKFDILIFLSEILAKSQIKPTHGWCLASFIAILAAGIALSYMKRNVGI